jgi:hypothetical protein
VSVLGFCPLWWVEEDDFMKRVLFATCIAAACAVGLSAQQTTTAQSGRRMGGPMTLTGCVKAGETSGTYMLTNIQRGDTGMGSGSTTTTAGAATTTASGSGMGQGMGRGMSQIMLNASGDVDLSAHVGHKVEVTGTMSGGRGRMGGGAATTTESGGSSAAGGSTTAGAATTTAGQGGGRGMRTMSVTSLKMVSTDCGN